VATKRIVKASVATKRIVKASAGVKKPKFQGLKFV
jgi:hypothetical protein